MFPKLEAENILLEMIDRKYISPEHSPKTSISQNDRREVYFPK